LNQDGEFEIGDDILKQVQDRILNAAPILVEQLILIITNDERNEDGSLVVPPNAKLQAIGMLLDRAVPKLGVDNSKKAEVEDSPSRKRMKNEIEEMIRKELNKGDG